VVELRVSIDADSALERVLSEGDEWLSWRALRLSGEDPGELPPIPDQDETGGFLGASGRLSPGATGIALCRFVTSSLGDRPAAVIAADWLEESRTPAEAWLDAPDDFPGDLDTAAGARVWATASASCGLLSMGRDPGHRAIDLLRGEADVEGRFTGGGYPTFAAAGAYWLADGPKNEIAEWALRWAREHNEEWTAEDRAAALAFWASARVPPEHPSVELFLDDLKRAAPEGGFEDLELTLATLELLARYE
jgi:hypothetical protein